MSPSISYTYCIPNPILDIMEEEGRKMKKEKMEKKNWMGNVHGWRKEEKWGKNNEAYLPWIYHVLVSVQNTMV